MTDIYIDPSVAGMPDAADHLSHLVDTGHGLILVGDPPEPRAKGAGSAPGSTTAIRSGCTP